MVVDVVLVDVLVEVVVVEVLVVSASQQTFLSQRTIGCTPNVRVPMVVLLFSLLPTNLP